MAVIGIELDPDQLVLVKDRDFRWAFDNTDEAGAPEDFPAGDLYFELFTGGEHNAVQRVSVLAASNGTYKLGVGGFLTAPIDYYDATVNPYGIAGDVTDALEALTSVGAGNVIVHPATLTPVWEVKITLNASVDEVQEIYFPNTPTGGQFKLGYNAARTGLLTFSTSDMSSTLQTAIGGLSGIGSGNVTVAKTDDYTYRVKFGGTLSGTNVGQLQGFGWGLGWGLAGAGFFPGIKTTTIVQGLAKLSEPLVNLFNTTINNIFDSFDTLIGVNLEWLITDEKNITFRVTSLKTYEEQGIITFGVNVTSNIIENALNATADLFDVLDAVDIDFYWNHVYEVEFVNGKGNQSIPKMTVDTTGLTGGGSQRVEVEVIETGKEPTTKWPFVISGSTASLKVESEEVNKILPRTRWHLAFLPDGEAVGGDPVARGRVTVQE